MSERGYLKVLKTSVVREFERILEELGCPIDLARLRSPNVIIRLRSSSLYPLSPKLSFIRIASLPATDNESTQAPLPRGVCCPSPFLSTLTTFSHIVVGGLSGFIYKNEYLAQPLECWKEYFLEHFLHAIQFQGTLTSRILSVRVLVRSENPSQRPKPHNPK